ncbi:MAG: GreA/GreB family elongation factor [Paracoccaceae bacterium]|nr:GreA/GreB family elongation factor [Paracoccaceae bacterium]
MSRAFVREDRPDTEPLPDLPISPHPNYVTPRGLAALRARLAEAQDALAGLRAREDRLDRLPEKAAERDIRYLEARLASAIPVDPATQPRHEVAFAARVTVADTEGREASYEIVGEDEADAARGLVAPQAPLARALIGARVGEMVEWHKPSGTEELEILAIAYPA